MNLRVKQHGLSSNHKARPKRRAPGLLGLLLGLALLQALLGGTACSDSSCKGGRILDGACVAHCDESKCRTGSRCVQDLCRPSCSTNADCASGQSCGLWGFPDGTQGNYCVVLPPAAGPCPTPCDSAHGEHCVNGACRVECQSHFDCASIGVCADGVDSAGNPGQFCAPSSQPPNSGQFYSSCPFGSECDANAGFTCFGSGAGDLGAYCTRGCQADGDCAAGFYCGTDSRPPCEPACGFAGSAQNPACVHADQIGDGLAFQCSQRGVSRSLCRTRAFCSPCETDADCLGIPNQICARDPSGAKICTELCDVNINSCPWGNAGMCGVWDTALGRATCAHRFMKCTGTGQGCEPCLKDADCGPAGLCTSSSFTGEHWCIDLRVMCSCGGSADANGLCPGGGCPLTPGGLTMLCLDDPTSSITGACLGADTATNPLVSSPQNGCWPKR